MKKMLVLVLGFLLAFGIVSGSALAFSGAGSGTETDPYQISDWYELNEIRDNLTAHYQLENNIDETTDGYNYLVNTTDGWKPIGSSSSVFAGVFDGRGHKIHDLVINREGESNVGLFGRAEKGQIKNVHLRNVNVSGSAVEYDEGVGSLLGTAYSRSVGDHDMEIINCSATGVVRDFGDGYTGGLVGALEGYSDDWITNRHILRKSWADVDVKSDGIRVGGLVGQSYESKIFDSYALGSVEGDSRIGGLVGEIRDSSSITNSFSTGKVSGSSSVGGFLGTSGYGSGSVTNCYWNIETSGQSNGIGSGDGDVKGRTTNQMTDHENNYPEAYDGWDFTNIWKTTDWNQDHEGNTGYPALRWQEPIEEYTIIFDEQNNLEGVEIDIEGEDTIYTDEEGQATIELPDSQYSYIAIKEGYKDYEGDFEVEGEGKTIEFEMEVETHKVTFQEENELENVEIDIEGEDPIYTDEQGEATIELEDDTYSYTASKEGYYEYSNSVIVDGDEKTINFKMEEIEYIVTFEETNELEGVAIEVDGQTITTDSQGEVSIELTNGTYSYIATKEGYEDHTDDFIVDGEAKTITFTLDVKEYTISLIELMGQGFVDVDIIGDGVEILDSETSSFSVDHETEVVFTPKPDENWEWSEWTQDSLGESETFSKIIEDDYNVGVVFQEEEENLDPSIQVETLSAIDIDNTSATIRGDLTELEEIDEADLYFFWREENETVWIEEFVETSTSPTTFSHDLENLDNETTYEFYAYGEGQHEGVLYSDTGDVRTFFTQEITIGIPQIGDYVGMIPYLGFIVSPFVLYFGVFLFTIVITTIVAYYVSPTISIFVTVALVAMYGIFGWLPGWLVIILLLGVFGLAATLRGEEE